MTGPPLPAGSVVRPPIADKPRRNEHQNGQAQKNSTEVNPGHGRRIGIAEIVVSVVRDVFHHGIVVPDKMVDEDFKKSINKLPKLFVMMVLNHFRLKGENKKFTSTEKGINP